jgi:glycosyltransferase involved in cell wall biosynthesis
MFAAFRQIERTMTFDMVEMPECGAEGLLVTHATAAPTVVRFHSPAQFIMQYYDVRRGDVALCSALERIAMRGATAFTSSSRFLADAVRTRLSLGAPIHVLHNGIDVRWFDDTEQVDARHAFGIPRHRPIVLFVGRMERRKGIHLCPEIVGAIIERYDVAFVFAGDDLFGHVANELLPALADRQLRGSVHVLGRLEATQVRSVLRQADVVFLPSLWESCPYACLEAMAARRAIVASDAGGLPELIRSRHNGVLVPSGDIGAFVEALSEVIEDPALRLRLGENARRSVEREFLDEDVARRSVAFYERIRR